MVVHVHSGKHHGDYGIGQVVHEDDSTWIEVLRLGLWADEAHDLCKYRNEQRGER